ncbi:hypothetical protein KEM56_000998 [Ascosphaera pollenicola]|nr:hypothetical protein KEM56_000998 [Ascosphaera pollenicola]
MSPTTTDTRVQAIPDYHSLLYRILSWENPRKTLTSYLSIFSIILAARFLPLLRWFFKFQYIVLGLTVAFEVCGKLIFNHGLASSSRPRKYYTVPRETLDSLLEDAEQLFDFFLIEFQRILFVENLFYTVTTFFTALTAYFLVLYFPLWLLAIFGVTFTYFAPLIYITNKGLIDAEIDDLNLLLNAQIQHVKDLFVHHSNRAHSLVRNFVDEKQSQAHEFVLAKSQALKEAAAQAQTRRAALRAAKDKLAQGPTKADSSEMEEITIGRVGSSTPVVNPPPQVAAAESVDIETTEFPEAPRDDPKASEQNGMTNGVNETGGLGNGVADEEKEPVLA